MTKEIHQIFNLNEAIRISDYSVNVFNAIPTRKGIKKALKKGLILLNGKTAHSGDWLQEGDVITLLLEQKRHKIFKYRVEVLYEDEFIAVVNKPSALLTSGNKYKTLQNCLVYNLKLSEQKDAFAEPKLLHRLDFETSGILIVAKTHSSYQFIQNQFLDHSIVKSYVAVCTGVINGEGFIDLDIDNKKAITKYKAMANKSSIKYGSLSLIELNPQTGRTHQIRKHLSHIDKPILGDKLYGNESTAKYSKSQLLQANKIVFINFKTKEELIIKAKVSKAINAFFPKHF